MPITDIKRHKASGLSLHLFVSPHRLANWGPEALKVAGWAERLYLCDNQPEAVDLAILAYVVHNGPTGALLVTSDDALKRLFAEVEATPSAYADIAAVLALRGTIGHAVPLRSFAFPAGNRFDVYDSITPGRLNLARAAVETDVAGKPHKGLLAIAKLIKQGTPLSACLAVSLPLGAESISNPAQASYFAELFKDVKGHVLAATGLSRDLPVLASSFSRASVYAEMAFRGCLLIRSLRGNNGPVDWECEFLKEHCPAAVNMVLGTTTGPLRRRPGAVEEDLVAAKCSIGAPQIPAVACGRVQVSVVTGGAGRGGFVQKRAAIDAYPSRRPYSNSQPDLPKLLNRIEAWLSPTTPAPNALRPIEKWVDKQGFESPFRGGRTQILRDVWLLPWRLSAKPGGYVWDTSFFKLGAKVTIGSITWFALGGAGSANFVGLATITRSLGAKDFSLLGLTRSIPLLNACGLRHDNLSEHQGVERRLQVDKSFKISDFIHPLAYALEPV